MHGNHKHGLTDTPLYCRWRGIHSRCKRDPNYRHIEVCEEWNEFMPFYYWALASGFDENLSIDRIDNTKGYSPDNCRWVTTRVNNNNRRNSNRLPGTYYDYSREMWKSQIQVDNTTYYLGRYHTELEAGLSYALVCAILDLN